MVAASDRMPANDTSGGSGTSTPRMLINSGTGFHRVCQVLRSNLRRRVSFEVASGGTTVADRGARTKGRATATESTGDSQTNSSNVNNVPYDSGAGQQHVGVLRDQ